MAMVPASSRLPLVWLGLPLLLTGCRGSVGPAPTETSILPQVTAIELPTLAPTGQIEESDLVPAMPAFELAEPELLYSSAERAALGLSDWPASSISALPRSDGTFTFYAANGTSTARTIGPLGEPAKEVSGTSIPLTGGNTGYASAAPGSLYRDPDSGVLLMFYRAEINRPAPPGQSYSLVGLAISRDDGNSFEDLGPIVQPEFERGQSSPQPIDIGSGTHTIVDDHFYLYFKDYSAAGEPNYLAVARAPVETVIQGALAGQTVTWGKYDQGAFSQPALGGQSSPLELGNPELGWNSVSFNTVLDRYLMVLSHHTGVETNSQNLSLMTSPDGLRWSPRIPLTSGTPEHAYPSLLDDAPVVGHTGHRPFLYFLWSPLGGEDRWQDGQLLRRRITLDGLSEPSND